MACDLRHAGLSRKRKCWLAASAINACYPSILAVGGLFVFIGAKPSTEWLNGQLAMDEDGFVLTGADIPVAQLESVEHVPLLLETSRPGIFCVGDVRSRSVKRVATAIGEGSMAVRLVFDRLQVTSVAVAVSDRASVV
jgi:thioredoxin reductase